GGRRPARRGVGYYMDRQEQQLRQQLEGSQVEVRREGDNLKVVMPSQITFAFDSADILPGFYPSLNSVAQVLREHDQTTVEVTGHTDNIGTNHYNQQLSERRAQAVADYLAGQGVIGGRIAAHCMGETSPVASNDTESGRAQNRRVEIVIRPAAQPQAAPAYQQQPGYYPPATPAPEYTPPGYYPQRPVPGAYQAPAYPYPNY
ncbi:OmpA family protein, partial [Methylogaea oryzae]|uniref:OmpA family protein n=1 Tax=Methylogaea oryzae TaxID=1295382 RepID=UPI000AC6264A